jgi:hypothetical protein
VPQLPPLQEPQEQEEVPATGEAEPPSLTVKQAKVDSTRSALFLQLGQVAADFDWLNGRINSNLFSQLWQLYS